MLGQITCVVFTYVCITFISLRKGEKSDDTFSLPSILERKGKERKEKSIYFVRERNNPRRS